MNVAAGFNGLASLYYSSTAAVTVSIWSGLDGTGDELGVFNLTNNTASCTSGVAYCNWTRPRSISAPTVAHSVTFGSAVEMGFDNVAINTVPIPAALPLLSFGLAGMGAMLRRRKKAAV